jgi:hypothetical protein
LQTNKKRKAKMKDISKEKGLVGTRVFPTEGAPDEGRGYTSKGIGEFSENRFLEGE